MFLEMDLFSKTLKKHTLVNILLPHDRISPSAPCKVLWLLHGLTDDHNAWMYNSSIKRYADKYNLAVIMPNVDRSWYTNTAYGINYFDYITDELPRLCRSTFQMLSDKREDNIIAGLSMGGYGAMKASLTYPERYGTCISLSGALDVTRKGRPTNLNEGRSIFGYELKEMAELAGSEHDLSALAAKNRAEGKEFSKMYLWCGLDDALLASNREFDHLLTSLEVEHQYEESEGNHSWKWWDLHIQNGLRWALGDPN